jgi:hypothetical protein
MTMKRKVNIDVTKSYVAKVRHAKLVRRRLIEPPPTFCPNKINFQRRKRI